MSSEAPGMVGGDGGLRIRVPMSLKRRGGRKEIVVAQGLPRRRKPAPEAHSALVLAVVRGHRWKELLESGWYPSIDALAARMGIDGSYVGRHLNLALLAPDIVVAILMGREPDGLTLEKLYGLPLEWEGQRRALRQPHCRPTQQSILASQDSASRVRGGGGRDGRQMSTGACEPMEKKTTTRQDYRGDGKSRE